jgi:hypothetical protein
MEKLLVIDEASNNPPGIFGEGKDLKLQPNEMWPDGKVRPHKVKTNDGVIVRLTDEEYDQLVTAARHRYYANKSGPSARPRPLLKIGELVTPIYPEQPDLDGWPDFTVRSIKADGRVILASFHDDLGELARGVILRIKEQDYDVIRAAGNTVTIRLRPQ